jgi:hypothetical protein
MESGKQPYILCVDGMEWEDITLFILSKEEAIEKSKLYPKSRLELFIRCIDGDAYAPSYNYYQNGVLFENK